ncbi:hypothetical protein MXE97_20095, partial [Escherichia coli]|nr:hypothetical protein [Escherichia coli]
PVYISFKLLNYIHLKRKPIHCLSCGQTDMHLPPQAAGPDRSQFSYNMQKQTPEKPRSSAEPKPQSPSS